MEAGQCQCHAGYRGESCSIGEWSSCDQGVDNNVMIMQSCVTWTVASMDTARLADVSVTRAGMGTRVGCRLVTPGALNTVSVTSHDRGVTCDDVSCYRDVQQRNVSVHQRMEWEALHPRGLPR